VVFGQPFPQPVAAKVGDGGVIERIALGLAYYARSALLRPYSSTFFASLLGALGWAALRTARRERPAAALFLLLFVAAHAAMVATSGGDWMRGGRFFAQFAPITLVAAAGALHMLRSRARLVTAALAAAFLSNAIGMVALAFGESSGRPIWLFLARDPELRRYAPELHWSERANRIRTRDLLFLHLMLPHVGEMIEERGRVSIMSRQAGMVAYYVARRHFGRLRFIDINGLTSREATRVASAIGTARGATGVLLSPEELIPALEREGGAAARPDLLFDVRPRDRLLAQGYAVVLRQTGFEPGPRLGWGSRRLPGVAYSVDQYAAVDAKRWPGLVARPLTVDWSRAGGHPSFR
jgi:hypothetical protein